ncbi:MAG: diacylglycerol kinase [Tenericutes bacterium]|nr:diacylglycerol kinase [Mycoplasmatota bacterium]MDD7629434.1 diacylglycerol kinase [bacterium]MDY4108426.1 diacylglycerol kinase [Bacilli bacterium]
MATVSKDSKKINTLKEEFERRDLNVHSIRRVIKNSLEGISSYAKDGKSFIIYVFCSLIEIIAGFAFNVNGLEWILIISMLGIILAIELLNTAIEATCDAITKEFNPYIKVAKDCGSAATFVIFIVTVILNIIIFLPKIAF